MALLTMQEYLEKKKKDDELQHAISYVEYMRQNEIAPVKLTNKPSEITAPSLSDKKDKDEGLLDFFQKGAFEDGYQFGDVTKSILGTTGDAVVGVAKGIGSLGEGIVDLGKYGVAGVADVIGKDKYAEQVRKNAQENSVEEFFKGTDDYLNQYSVLGRTSDAVMQGVGQVGAIILTGGVAGALGAGAVGATVATSGLMGLSSAGSGMSEAYKGGATDKEATIYGISKGVIDAGSELIFGGLGKAVNAVGLSKGISSLDDVFAQKLSSKLSNQVAKNFAEFGVKASAEGFEEVIAGLGSAVAKKLTYMDEEELGQIVKDENLLEQFVVGTVTSGMIQSGYIPAAAQGSLKEANETGTDFITGYTQNEQAVIDKEVENRIKERETDGKKLTNKEISSIEEQVKKDLDKGYINIDTIESTLGGETYNKYKSLTEQEETLTKKLEELEKAPNTVGNAKQYEETQKQLEELKNKDEKTKIKEQLSKEVKEMTLTDRLSESYNEKSRRSQAFEADLTKYDAKQQEVIKKATESGILNNTNRTHEFVDMVAKISADKGVSFDFTNNAKLKETGFALEGKTVNGYVKDGNIAVNIDSAKALNTVVGHEITHVLEGTDLYTELQNVVKEFATTKGEYQTRYDALAELYKDVDGAVIENELTADLVGEYLFTDSDFVSRLSVEKPNIFKKIYEEIKYLAKLVTGSKEARELEKVKHAFDKAYRESSTKTKELSSEVTEEGIPVVDESKTQEYTRENEVIYSLSNDTAYMDNAIDKNKSLLNVDSKVMEEAKAVREKIAGRMNEIKDKGLVGLPEDIEGNTFISNSSYGGTEENTTICPRSLASEAFVDAVSEYLGRPLTVEEQIYISQDLQGRSLTPECTYCYVATDRKAYRAFLGEYVSQRDAVIDKVKNNPNADVSRNGELYKEFLNGRKDTNPMYNRFKMWVNNYKNGKPMIDASHLANINKLMGDINSEFGAELKPQITDAMKYAQSASWAKKRVNYVAYNGHILKWKQDRINKLNSHYGLRMYSFSDFHPAFVLENMQMITDASVRGLKMLGYTKDTDFVEIFAPTGMNINISTFGFETSGNVYENNIIGAEWEKAKALREQHPNVGITFVATNDTLVEWGLSQDWIDVVIPFHLVRTGKEVAKAFKYTDYTSESSDTKTSDWKKGDAKYIPPTEHNNDKATYLSALEKNHLKPRFERFVSNPNYMKLVNECRLPASESKPVQPIFNEDASMRALAKLEANGYYQPIGGSVDRMYEIASEVAENMQAELSPTQYSLGEQSAKTGDYRVYGKDIALSKTETTTPEVVAEIAPTTSTVEEMPIRSDYAPPQEYMSAEPEVAPVVEEVTPAAEDNERILGEDLTKKNADRIRTIQAEIKGHHLTKDITKKEFDEKIAQKESQYESLSRKDTKKAVDLRNQITRLETKRDSLLRGLDGKIERANKRIESIENESRFAKRITKQNEYRELFGKLMGDTSTWKDKKMGIQYQTNTFHRNLRDIVRDASGKQDIARADAIYDELQGSVNRNEAKKNREANEVKNVFREMKINNAESTYIQMLGELRHNPDTTLTKDVVDEFYKKNKGKIDVQKVDKAIDEARKLYDSLYDRVNVALSEHGFKEIGYRKGYFPHFTDPKRNWLAKLLNWKVNNDEIPTDIAGLTEMFEPQRTWQSFDKHRKTDTTDYNFLKGLDNYVNGSLDWIYHIEDIQKHRAFENEIRYRHSSEQVQKKIDEYRNNPMLSAEEVDTLIQSVLREAKNPLNNFVTDLHTRTNILAGKKSSKDRNMESDFNRHAYSVMTNITNRVTANQVVGSISSAMTNFIPITQSWGQVNPTSSLVGMKKTIQSYMSDDGVVAKSDFLTNRLAMNEALYKDAWDKIGDKVGGLMEIVDNFTSQTVWRSKYHENIKKGMTEAQAIKDADQFAENVIGGRSKGNMPTIFHAKNPVTKMLTSFQLEVANQYGYIFKDMPQDIGKKAIGKLVKGYATMFIGAYAYNALYSSLVGRDAALDPLGIIEDFIRDLGGDDDEEEDVAGAIGGLASNVADEIPFVGGLLGGGRIPISSALPYNASISDAYADVVDKDWKSVLDELSKPLYYGVMPMGGGQIRKTVQGLSMFDKDLPVSGSYTKSGNLRFPVEDTFLNKLQAGVFGQYASENARDYFDNERNPLKEKQIQEYKDLDIPIKDYWEIREGISKHSKLADQADYIASLDLPVAKKNILINNVSQRKEAIDMTNYDDFSSFEEFDYATKNPEKYAFSKAVGGYSAYKSYQEALSDISADKDENGKTINGSRKEKVLDYINGLDADYYEKIILFKSEYNADDTYNNEIIEYLNNRSDISYEEEVEILKGLGFEVDADGNIYW